ncbi:MAG: helix-turn-helix transcriptional regulator [Candidatus Bathyarchaeota archaeon]|nr:MAG: helix-turn-helix transcriptional regulator [Candidatus Bathyarchaeota archaeon]
MSKISNRDKILMELLKEPLTFTKLKEKVGVSGKTLAKHLKSLKDEGLLKREIQGKYIVYVVVEPQTCLQMRKEFWNKLLALYIVYRGCLTKETLELFSKIFKALGKSIRDPELEAESTKIMVRLIKIPEGLEKGMGIEVPENIFKKVKTVKLEKPKTRGRRRG